MTQLRARYANAERGIPSEADHPDLEDHHGFACGEAESVAVDAGQIKSFRVRSLGVFVRRCRNAYVNEPAYRPL
jgi:hypothetical protein